MAFSLSCCLSLGASEHQVQRVRIDLPAALPWQEGTQRGFQDLELLLAWNGTELEPQGWALIPALPDQVHPVTIGQAELESGRWRLQLQLIIRDRHPSHEGGIAEVDLILQRRDRRLDGDFVVRSRHLAEAERGPMRRALRGTAADPTDLRGRMLEGEQRSETKPGRWLAGKPGLETLAFATGWRQATGRIVSQSAHWPLPARGELFLSASGMTALRRWASGPGSGTLTWVNERHNDSLEWPAQRLIASLLLQRAGQTATARSNPDLVQAILAELAAPEGGNAWFRHSLNLLALSWSVDAANDWPAATLTTVIDTLRSQSLELAGQGPARRESPYAHPGLLGDVSEAGDPRLIALGAAAATALRAVVAQRSDDSEAQRGLRAADVLLRRQLAAGIGRRGAPLGHAADDELRDLAAAALGGLVGADPAEFAGLAQAGRWLSISGAWDLRAGDQRHGAWSASLIPVSLASHRPALAWYAQTFPPQPVDALQAALIARGLALAPAAREPAPGMVAEADEDSGALAVRGSWQPDAVCVSVGGGRGLAGAAGWQRQLLLAADRAYFDTPPIERGRLAWPVATEANALIVGAGVGSGSEPATPTSGVSVRRVQARGQSASIGQFAGNFRSRSRHIPLGPIEGAELWTTTAVDLHADGADLVVVGGCRGFADRERLWRFDLGPWSTERDRSVDIQGGVFTLRAKGQPQLRIEVLYPSGARATARRQGERLILELRLADIEAGVEDGFADSLESGLFDLRRIDTRPAAVIQRDDLSNLNLDALDPVETAARIEAARRVYSKLFRVATDTSMGAPYLRERIRGSVVMAISLGQRPRVAELAASEDSALLRIGRRQATWWEYLVAFGPISGGAKP